MLKQPGQAPGAGRRRGLTAGPFGHRAAVPAALVLAVLVAMPERADAQIDPLIALKRLPPNVIVMLDTSFPMLLDANGDFYDLKTYATGDDPTVALALNMTTPQYRRIYRGLQFEANQTGSSKYFATDITPVPSSAVTFSSFWAPTRFEIAKAGFAQAVVENPNLVRWGLLKLRQDSERWRDATSSSDCDKPVRITNNVTLSSEADTTPCAAGGGGQSNKFVLYAPATNGANHQQTSGPGDSVLYGVGSANATSNIRTALQQPMGSGALIPAGRDTDTYVDRPLYHALIDARAHAVSAIAADGAATRDCRNTVVVLVTSGKDGGDSSYMAHGSIAALAGTFSTVPAGTGSRRVPIVVIGLSPAAADEVELQAIANASGGEYFRATNALEVARAVNYAVQMGFANPGDVDAMVPSDYTFVSPIVGSVNLVGAQSATGALLPNTDILSTAGPTSGQPLPQRSNFMLVGGFSLPGFDGKLRAFRTFKPEPDPTKATGWKFTSDGTRLWPDLDYRPELAGIARTPASSASRNIYTYIPNGAGGGTMVAFTVANGGLLSAYLGGADPNVVIPYVRSQPLGAIIGSTPAIMDPPSLDPPPDAAYGFPSSVGTFAGDYKDRRAIIFFGANDGMVHAVDARTGYEVWAFIPFNLLPKLRTLVDGQSVERFDYFVDSSPKIAEVKVSGAWRTMLIIGQSYGGTFYQAFDVTDAGMGLPPDADGLTAVSSMLAKFDTPDESIQFSWAFPRYSVFNPNVNYTNSSLGTAFPGGQVVFYGDLMSTASNVEKRVGFTFSDPAVGPLITDRSVTAVITGSGYFPSVEDFLPGRGSAAPRAGRALFLLDVATGLPIGNASGGSCNGNGCYDVGGVSGGAKNAIQADVTASGDAGSTVVTRAYVGDLDGRYWRFSFDSTGTISATTLVSVGQPILSSSALLFVGTTEKYLFFGTGSDLLPAMAPGGGGSGSGTAFKLYGIRDGASSGTVVFSKSLSPAVVASTSALPTNGERPTSSPTVAGDIVFFTTTTDSLTASCTTDPLAKLYAFTYLGTAAYDTSGNNKIDANESPIVATTVGRGTAPFIVDQHLFMGVSNDLGAGVTILGDPEDFNNGVGQVGVRILSWREIR
jgi:hypothetical protein